MACFNKAPFILQFVCLPLHEAVKPQAAPFKIKKAQLKPSPSALLKSGLFPRSLHTSSSQLREAVTLCALERLPSELIIQLFVSAPLFAQGMSTVGNSCLCWKVADGGAKTFLHRLGL